MRELVIRRPLTRDMRSESVILDHPSLTITSIQNNVGGGHQAGLWLLQGTKPALAAFERRFVKDPPAQIEIADVVERSRDGILLYALERTGSPGDIAGLVERHFGGRAATRVHKSRAGSTWRISLPDDADPEPFLAAVSRAERRAEPGGEKAPRYQVRSLLRVAERSTLERLTPLERSVTQAALEVGYFDVPRRAGVAAIGRALKMSASTVSYHLRHAQRKLAEHAVSEVG